MIAIDDLHKSYRTADGRLSAVLKGLSLQVPERSITAVVGPSGAGKTTLFRCITGSAKSDTGRIRFGGTEIERLRVDHAVHAVADGRICLAALNAGNLPSVAAAIRQVSSRH